MSKDYFCFCVDCFDICFWISTIIVPFLTYLVIQKLRPWLNISALSISDKCIKVKVSNKSYFFDANNIRIEICIFNKAEGFTFHFEPDHTDFLILPCHSFFRNKDNTKTFASRKIAESALIILNEENEEGNDDYDKITGFDELLKMLNDGYKVRVRCHAYHSFSGLGKSFEQIF